MEKQTVTTELMICLSPPMMKIWVSFLSALLQLAIHFTNIFKEPDVRLVNNCYCLLVFVDLDCVHYFIPSPCSYLFRNLWKHVVAVGFYYPFLIYEFKALISYLSSILPKHQNTPFCPFKYFHLLF